MRSYTSNMNREKDSIKLTELIPVTLDKLDDDQLNYARKRGGVLPAACFAGCLLHDEELLLSAFGLFQPDGPSSPKHITTLLPPACFRGPPHLVLSARPGPFRGRPRHLGLQGEQGVKQHLGLCDLAGDVGIKVLAEHLGVLGWRKHVDKFLVRGLRSVARDVIGG